LHARQARRCPGTNAVTDEDGIGGGAGAQAHPEPDFAADRLASAHRLNQNAKGKPSQ
jgi:hypothetical protein